MSCRVPDFVPDDDNPVFACKIPDRAAGEDFVELLWRKRPVLRRGSPGFTSSDPAVSSRIEPLALSGVSSHAAPASATMASTELFMEEDEMASWLYYPLGGDDDPAAIGGVGGVDPSEQPREAAAAAGLERGFPGAMAEWKVETDGWAASGRPPLHPETRGGRTAGSVAPPPQLASRESTVVDSSSTPRIARAGRGGAESRGEGATCEHGLASSSGVSYEGEAEEEGEAAAMTAGPGDERKRRGREDDEFDSHSEDADFESGGKRRDLRRPASARRARAAEVHNLSERRRRDRINEKMKALQQLIPRCNKTDKASMLDDAIEYMKSLQMQVQMMSMCYNMAPMMFPGMQQYMPSVGMGIPMGMGMGMGVGMGMGMEMTSRGLSRPIMPFSAVMPAAQMAANGAAHLGQRIPLQPVHAPVAALADQMRLQVTSQADLAASSSASTRAPSAVQMPNLSGLCHQNRSVTEPGANKGTSMPERSKLG